MQDLQMDNLASTVLIRRLGYGGLLPFVLLTFLMWVVNDPVQPFVTLALTAYAACIAAFLGGVHWGIALPLDSANRRFHLVWGVVPSLVSWLCLIMPAYAGLPMLALLLLVCWWVDKKTWPASWSHWLGLRTQLTTVAVLACLLGASAT